MTRRIALFLLVLALICPCVALASGGEIIIYARVVSENRQNTPLYELPGEYRNIITTLKHDTQLHILFEGSTWHKVQVANGKDVGWMKASEIRVTSRGVSAINYGCTLGRACTAKSGGDNALRWGPGKMYDAMDSLPAGRYMWVFETVDGWSRVLLEDGRIGYILSSQTQSAKRLDEWPAGLKGYVQVSGNSANFRDAPNYSSKVIGQLYTGDVVEILGEKNYFYQVYDARKDRTGYLSIDIISPESLNETKRNTQVYYDNPDQYSPVDVIRGIEAGEKVKVLATDGYYSRIECGELVGYVNSYDLKY